MAIFGILFGRFVNLMPFSIISTDASENNYFLEFIQKSKRFSVKRHLCPKC